MKYKIWSISRVGMFQPLITTSHSLSLSLCFPQSLFAWNQPYSLFHISFPRSLCHLRRWPHTPHHTKCNFGFFTQFVTLKIFSLVLAKQIKRLVTLKADITNLAFRSSGNSKLAVSGLHALPQVVSLVRYEVENFVWILLHKCKGLILRDCQGSEAGQDRLCGCRSPVRGLLRHQQPNCHRPQFRWSSSWSSSGHGANFKQRQFCSSRVTHLNDQSAKMILPADASLLSL